MKNNKPNNNYFADNIARFGKDFLKQKNTRNLDLESNRIFRDIARGNVDIEKHGKYFLDKTFLSCLIKNAQEKFDFYDISFRGVSMFLSSLRQDDPIVIAVMEKHKRSAVAYNMILHSLIDIQRTNDYNYLYRLAKDINQFRYDL